MNPEEQQDKDAMDLIALKVIRARQLLEQFAADPDTFYYICPKKLGDTLHVLGFARAAARRSGCSRLTVVVKSWQRLFAEFYSHLFDAVSVSDEDMDAIEWFTKIYQIYQGENWLYAYIRAVPFEWSGKLSFRPDCLEYINTISSYDCIRWTFSLPARTRFDPMRIQPPEGMREALAEKYSLNPEKTIVLMPYAYSLVLSIDASFWATLASYLTESGYTVYSNVGYKGEGPVPGTLPMHTTFEELYCVSQSIRAFISMRSGITDFLALAAAPQIVLTSAGKLSMQRDFLCVSEELGIPCRTIQLSLQNSSFLWLICTIDAILRRPAQEFLLPEPED